MKHTTSITLFIILCSFTSATLQCSITRSTTIADIAITRNQSDNFEHHSGKFNKAHTLNRLKELGLLDNDISKATTAEEAVEIFNLPCTKKKSGNLPITTYVVLNNLPHIGLLLLDAGYDFDPMDFIRLKTQLNMLAERKK